MAIVGFNFTHLHTERNKKLSSKDQIKSDMRIDNIDFEELPVGQSEEAAKFEFTFEITYGEDVGKTVLKGYVLNVDTPDKTKKMVEEWKASKKMDTDVMAKVLNMVLYKCNVKSLTLTQDVGLPPHFKLPKVTVKTK